MKNMDMVKLFFKMLLIFVNKRLKIFFNAEIVYKIESNGEGLWEILQ
jgi:hypothetical protein